MVFFSGRKITAVLEKNFLVTVIYYIWLVDRVPLDWALRSGECTYIAMEYEFSILTPPLIQQIIRSALIRLLPSPKQFSSEQKYLT